MKLYPVNPAYGPAEYAVLLGVILSFFLENITKKYLTFSNINV